MAYETETGPPAMFDSLTNLFRNIGDLFRWWVVLCPWEAGIRVRAGYWIAVIGGGIHLRIPFVDRFFVQSVRLRVATLPTQTVTTRDGKTVTVGGTLGYSVGDILQLYQTLQHAHDTLVNLAASALAQCVRELDASDLDPMRLQDAATRTLSVHGYGIAQATIRVTDFALVRTYRLIMDGRGYSVGAALQTESPNSG